MSENIALEQKVDTLNGHVIGLQQEVSGFRSAIEKLTNAMLELVRIDSNMQHLKTEMDQSIQWNKLQDKRITDLEINSAVNSNRIGAKERTYWLFFSAGVSVLTGLIVYVVQH